MADPAFRGFVESTLDALLVFEGCSRGALPKITRRLQEFEKRALVVSGAVFVFDEEETGIKRWTDGLTWSPSRTLGNFLVYRELDKKAGGAGGGMTGEGDEMAPIAGTSASTGMELPFDDTPLDNAASMAIMNVPSERRRSLSDTGATSPPLDRARERALVGSLTSTYRFRSDGLVKKTISLAGLHMIGYYKIDDVTSGRLRTPSSHSELAAFEVSSAFLAPSLFRAPPLVEVGADGQLRYKGEPETPVSPSLARSGSSQGFSSPALGSMRSRPPSSDQLPQRSTSPRLPPLSASSSSSSHRDQPGSPHRSATSLRTSNRFDPYGVPSRASPSLNTSTYGSHPASYFQMQPPSSPNRAAYALDELYQATSREAHSHQSPILSQGLSMMSSSAPAQTWGMSPQHMASAPPPRNSNVSDPASSVRNFYQPRHATPFSPDEQPLPSSGPATSGIFAFQAPSTGRLSRPSSATSPPPPLYQHYSSPPQPPPPPAPIHTPPTPQYSTSPMQQQPPPQSQQQSQQQQQQQTYPGGIYRPFSQAGPPSSAGSYSSTPTRISQIHSSHSQSLHSAPPPPPPPPHHHTPSASTAQYDYSILSQPSFPSYTMASTSTYPAYDSRMHSGSAGGIPSGLVMGVASGEPSDDEERHGLGLRQSEHLSHGGGGGRGTLSNGDQGLDQMVGPGRSDVGRRVKPEPIDQGSTQWWQQPSQQQQQHHPHHGWQPSHSSG